MRIETPRLIIREYTLEDAPFILQMLNEPTYIQNIRDNGVRTIADAESYINDRILGPFKKFGFGYHVIERRSDSTPLGQCGIVQRDFLKEPDLGFSFLMDYQRQGFGLEAVSAFLQAPTISSHKKLHAFTSLDNMASQRLLLKLGFKDMGLMKYDQTEEDVRLFTR